MSLFVGACGSSDDSGGAGGTAGTTGGSAGTSGTPGGSAGTSGTSGGLGGTDGGTGGTDSGPGGTDGSSGTDGGPGGTDGGPGGTDGSSGTDGGTGGTDGGSGGIDGSARFRCGYTPPHTLTVTWSLKKADGTADVCLANYSTIKVSAQVVSDFNPPNLTIGSPFQALFDCQAGQGTIELPTSGDQEAPTCYGDGCSGGPVQGNTGKYSVTLYLTESSGESVEFAAPLVVHSNDTQPELKADMSSGDRSLAFEFYPTAGFILLDWGFQAKSNSKTLSCAASGVDTVKLHTHLTLDADGNAVNDGPEYTDVFTCAGDPAIEPTAPFTVAAGLSRVLDPGQYHILGVEAFASGQKVGEADPSGLGDATVSAGANVNVGLPESYFMVIENR